nr:Chain CCC, Chaperone protein DnaK [Mycobacterium tuberculosis]
RKPFQSVIADTGIS